MRSSLPCRCLRPSRSHRGGVRSMSGTPTGGESPCESRADHEHVHVLGCDPGTITGFAFFTCGRLAQHAVGFHEVEDNLRAWLTAYTQPLVVAVERFVITRNTAKKTQQTDALKLSGVVQSVAERHPGVTFTYQNMSDAKKIGQPALLRSLGWWRTGLYATHMNDAAAHVVKALADLRPATFHALMTPDII